jgi:hypothetical protein
MVVKLCVVLLQERLDVSGDVGPVELVAKFLSFLSRLGEERGF